MQASGILVSPYPEPERGQNGVLDIASENDKIGTFTVLFDEEKNMTSKYYFRAYASNQEGVSYGFTAPIHKAGMLTLPNFLGGEEIYGASGWWKSPWLGNFYTVGSNGWVMHETMGWVFVFPGGGGSGLWLWQKNQEWLWTDREIFPFLFNNNKQSWVFYYGGIDNQLLFFDYQKNQWIQNTIQKEL